MKNPLRPRYSTRYKPDPAFAKKLKAFDPILECRWRDDAERFVIVQNRPAGPPYELWICEDETGGFRQPSELDLMKLHIQSLERKAQKVRDIEMRDRRQSDEEKQERNIDDDMKHAAADNKNQFMKAYHRDFNLGKGNATFRRIEPKPQGYVVKDKRKVK